MCRTMGYGTRTRDRHRLMDMALARASGTQPRISIPTMAIHPSKVGLIHMVDRAVTGVDSLGRRRPLLLACRAVAAAWLAVLPDRHRPWVWVDSRPDKVLRLRMRGRTSKP